MRYRVRGGERDREGGEREIGCRILACVTGDQQISLRGKQCGASRNRSVGVKVYFGTLT